MAKFSDYLKFTENINYRDKQVEAISKIELSKEDIERLEKISRDIKLIVFAHPECPDCLKLISILEAIKKHIPSIEIDYRSRKLDKNLLLSINPDGKIPTVVLSDDIKLTLLVNEFPDCVLKEMSNKLFGHIFIRNNYHNGKYDNIVINELIEKLSIEDEAK